MAMGILLPLRIAQAFSALVILGLSSIVAFWYNADTKTSSPSQINWLIFLPIHTLLSIAYLELSPRFFARVSHPYAHLVVEGLTTLFYFAGFIAISVYLSKLLFCRGSVCAAARADAVFAAFGFLVWLTSTTLLALTIFKGGFRRANAGLPSGREKDTVGAKAVEA